VQPVDDDLQDDEPISRYLQRKQKTNNARGKKCLPQNAEDDGHRGEISAAPATQRRSARKPSSRQKQPSSGYEFEEDDEDGVFQTALGKTMRRSKYVL
jgi:hypothetical protein